MGRVHRPSGVSPTVAISLHRRELALGAMSRHVRYFAAFDDLSPLGEGRIRALPETLFRFAMLKWRGGRVGSRRASSRGPSLEFTAGDWQDQLSGL
jgi:hypothetical protein